MDQDVLSDLLNDLESDLSGYWKDSQNLVNRNLGKWVPYLLLDENEQDNEDFDEEIFYEHESEYPYRPIIYRFTHDQNQGDYMFVVGEELFEIKTDNGCYGDVSQENEDRLKKINKLIENFSSTITEEEKINKKKRIVQRIPELKKIELLMYPAQNHCQCCS